jgi:hypothetical protein
MKSNKNITIFFQMFKFLNLYFLLLNFLL